MIVNRVLLRPEVTVVVSALAIFMFFAIDAGSSGFLSMTGTRTYLEVGAMVGIVAAPATLLMVAGEFDLSLGAMIGAEGIIIFYPIAYHHWPLWAALLLGLSAALIVGIFNSFITVGVGIPSFLVTLAAMFGLEGVTLTISARLTGSTQIYGLHDALRHDWLLPIFGGTLFGFPAAVYWWLGLTLVCAYVLEQTKFGNWIYAVGGNLEGATTAGVPVAFTKMVLFVATSAAAAVVATLASLGVDTADANYGPGKEFQVVVAVVLGGATIGGGTGSVLGTGIGAALFGMVSEGFYYTNIDDNWFLAFLAIVLLLAVVINKYTLRFALGSRKSA